MLRRVFSGGVYSIFGKLTSSVVQLLLMPLFLGLYGKEEFGLYLLLVNTLSIVVLANFGITKGLQNKISSRAFGTERERDVAISNALFFVVAVAVSVGILVALYFFYYISAGLNAKISGVEVWIFALIAFFLGMLALLNSFNCDVLNGLGRPDLAKKSVFLINICAAIMMGVAAIIKPSYIAFVAWTTLLVYFIGSGYGLFCWASEVRLRGRPVSWVGIRSLFDEESRGFLVLQVIQTLTFGADIFIISNLLGINESTEYGVAFKVYTMSVFIFASFTSSLWPFVSQLKSQDRIHDIYMLFKRVYRYGLLYSIIVLTGMWLAGDLAAVWLGSDFFSNEKIFPLLGVQAFFMVHTALIIPVLNGLNLLKVQTRFGVIMLTAKIVLSLALAPDYGVYGVIAATILSHLLFCYIPYAFVLLQFLKRGSRC